MVQSSPVTVMHQYNSCYNHYLYMFATTNRAYTLNTCFSLYVMVTHWAQSKTLSKHNRIINMHKNMLRFFLARNLSGVIKCFKRTLDNFKKLLCGLFLGFAVEHGFRYLEIIYIFEKNENIKRNIMILTRERKSKGGGGGVDVGFGNICKCTRVAKCIFWSEVYKYGKLFQRWC